MSSAHRDEHGEEGQAGPRAFAASIRSRLFAAARSTAVIALGGVVLCWPALVNGYPLLWWDSKGYLDAALDGSFPWARSPFYGLAIRPLLLGLGTTWSIVAAQALLAATVMYLVLRDVLGRSRIGDYLTLLMLLAALTALPWVTSEILADVFAGLLGLGLYLLAFGRGRLKSWEIVLLELATTLCAIVHYSHLGLAVALGLIALLLPILAKTPRAGLAGTAALLLLPALAAAMGQIAFQARTADRLAIFPYAPIFLLARMAQDGSAKTYLEAHCPERRFVLCGTLDRLPMNSDDFLWADDGPLHQAGGPQQLLSEARAIVLGSLQEQPALDLRLALADGLRQLTFFDTTHGLLNFDFTDTQGLELGAFLRQRLPRDFPAVEAARQRMGPSPLPLIDRSHRWTVGASILLLLVFSPLLVRRRAYRVRALIAMALAAVIANAFICGIISGPHERYQSRVIWLLPFAASLGAMALLRGNRDEAPATGA